MEVSKTARMFTIDLSGLSYENNNSKIAHDTNPKSDFHLEPGKGIRTTSPGVNNFKGITTPTTPIKEVKEEMMSLSDICDSLSEIFDQVGTNKINNSIEKVVDVQVQQVSKPDETSRLKRKRVVQKYKEDRVFDCGKCEYSTKRKASLKMHVESEHEGIRYPCSQCEYTTKQRSNLRIHVDSKHEGIRYPCSQCDFNSSTKSHLNTHMKNRHSHTQLSTIQQKLSSILYPNSGTPM